MATHSPIFKLTNNYPRPKYIPPEIRTQGTSSQLKLVVPGELIASTKFSMRGHGTFVEDNLPIEREGDAMEDVSYDQEETEGDETIAPMAEGEIRSSLAGSVERINKLVSVRGLRGRYRPEVGDLVIGRITEVQAKRWKVDAGGRTHALLMLGSVNLPGGVQRRKLESDELQMRCFFQEGDLLVAEVQAFFNDGVMSLHTRSLKYGKLRNGLLVKVSSQLIHRLKSHFHTLSCGLDLIIGINGWIWIAKKRELAPEDELQVTERSEGFEVTTEDMYSDTNEQIDYQTRLTIARVAACINTLASHSMPISDLTIGQAYKASIEVSQSMMTEDAKVDTADLMGFCEQDFQENVIAAMLAH
ncbi:hypothetical protein CROQUDRAFT_650772 [Cronartium quercuum f. sp. fusiforme G11]|uniref:Ribosomal RNA-processing protein 4 n=1 Tax=Cronartium quercuum f. sp. fusiforme G11 TaxID=708437 RepID=A0A9P6NYC5_9BASI|nr:hypothetical protein CROQUDRAFT_650772 [Cronartium quercuum f. sp. fusiforme G11]